LAAVPEDEAMEKVTSEATLGKAALTMGPDSIEAEVRGPIRGWIEELVEAELTTVLGAEVSARPGGCAKGIGMAIGSARRVPVLAPRRFSCRASWVPAGPTQEWQSAVVPRYQRRTGRGCSGSISVARIAGAFEARSRRC
jgi:hypothetical protein